MRHSQLFPHPLPPLFVGFGRFSGRSVWLLFDGLLLFSVVCWVVVSQQRPKYLPTDGPRLGLRPRRHRSRYSACWCANWFSTMFDFPAVGMRVGPILFLLRPHRWGVGSPVYRPGSPARLILLLPFGPGARSVGRPIFQDAPSRHSPRLPAALLGGNPPRLSAHRGRPRPQRPEFWPSW